MYVTRYTHHTHLINIIFFRARVNSYNTTCRLGVGGICGGGLTGPPGPCYFKAVTQAHKGERQ